MQAIAIVRLPYGMLSVFEFSDSSCVVVGTFNIYIIQPQWLVEIGVIQEGDSVKMQADFRNPGFKFNCSKSANVQWSVRPDRLQIQSKEFNTDCGQPLADVLTRLPWTPVFAIGCNATFKAPVSDWDKVQDLFGTADIYNPQYVGVQKTWHRGFKREHLVFNIQMSVQEEHVELLLNIHTEAKAEKGIGSANEIAQKSCAAFLQQRDEAISLAESLIKMEIRP